MTPTHRAQQFLTDNGLSVADLDPEALLPQFNTAMTRGLDGATDALPMIPAFVTIDRPVPPDTRVAVLDAGGTNLRVALVWFDAHGKPHIEDYTRHRMPGTQGELSAGAFYDALADLLAPLAARVDSIGFCFSYPAEITPDCDARLLRWTKQVKAPEVVGTMVGSCVRVRLARHGCDRPITVLNDTVATLLAGKSAGISRRYGSYVGFILGTGTNTAYVESNRNIRKRRDLDPLGAMAINVESGSFSHAPRSRFDLLFDATTADCGAYVFEKMIAGAYLGGVGGTILKAAATAGLFTPATAQAVLAMALPSSKDLSHFCHNPWQPPEAFIALPLSEDDRRVAVEICTPVYVRAALLTAVNIAAAVIRTGAGADPLHPVAVNIDGSTYHLTVAAAFASRVQQHLRSLLEPRGIHYELISVDEAPIIGAAVAGLTRL
ncbi:MAG: hexokinase [Kiritimatiellia bacterium]